MAGPSAWPASSVDRSVDAEAANRRHVVSRDTNEQEFAAKRQRFLAEQGYSYDIVDASDVVRTE